MGHMSFQAFLAFQSVASAAISSGIGTWQAAKMTQFTGFVLALVIVLALKDRSYRDLPQVPPLYASGGMLAAIVLFSSF